MVRVLFTFASTLLTTSLALQAPDLAPARQGRRQALSFIGTSIAGIASVVTNPEIAKADKARTGPNSVFQGDYDDPMHPGCLRQVKVVGAPLRGDGTRSSNPVLEITGYDSKGSSGTCTDRPTRSDLWKISGTVKSNEQVLIDFSPKGGPENLVGKWDGGGIVFPDGNKWTKVTGGTNDRRPKDMSTLKSD
mmetsp:Transcript_41994/g.82338  ORF Transcript_41994/g.82338 Transcript_41994/m.82338 type:complete len:191 (+) Transcript_41994:60-632(+)|eukprot:CAMPEP_0194310708 /NCGR_PEP_ID=MMETSP0171-20130528/7681_1 /TAXON_ID=218684 /ORGANISM="Corethron pennatum, Strain L29A3" /LENGTH=190 /DNA_ID=CAMNT_0039064477 /DNA_START=8 /DNA_END=580 /DNA_ORIENTATION=-